MAAADDFPSLAKRTTTMVSKPQRLRGEIGFASHLLAIHRLDALTAFLEEVNIPERDDLHDKVSMLRLAFDAAERLWIGTSETDSRFWFSLIQRSVTLYKDEPDVVVSGLRLLGVLHMDLDHSLYAEVLNRVMDMMQRYSPPSPAHRPRVLRRLEYAQDTELMFGVVMSKRSGQVLGEEAPRDFYRERSETSQDAHSPPPITDSDVTKAISCDVNESSSLQSEASSRAVPSVPAKRGWSRTKGDTQNVQRCYLLRCHI